MPCFAANLTTLFTEHSFFERFSAASQAGFRAVEFLFPHEFHAVELANRLAGKNLQVQQNLGRELGSRHHLLPHKLQNQKILTMT